MPKTEPTHSVEDFARRLLTHPTRKVVSRQGRGGNATSALRTGLDDASKWAPAPEMVLDALRVIWGGMEVQDHNAFVRVLAAAKAALGSRREEFYEDVLALAPGVRSSEEGTEKRWESIRDSELGWPWLADQSGLS